MELLTVVELAEKLRIRPATVRLWAREGVIPAIKINSKITRYVYEDVVQSLEDRQETGHVQ